MQNYNRLADIGCMTSF